MFIPNLDTVQISFDEKSGYPNWQCRKCGGINVCFCDPFQTEPICNCGYIGYECQCEEIEKEEKTCFAQSK